jgi:DNA-binding transcriptional regulator YiaG
MSESVLQGPEARKRLRGACSEVTKARISASTIGRSKAPIRKGGLQGDLREARIAQGVSQEKLAQRLLICCQTLSRWERGYRRANFLGVCDWANALGYEIVLRKKETSHD